MNQRSSAGIHRSSRIIGGLWGAAAGDTLGVPVEFSARASVQSQPVTGMRGYGTHGQPPGTWSDDTSLSLCTVSSLLHAEFDTGDMARRFAEWHDRGYWSPHGEVFDIGVATAGAIQRIRRGTSPEEAGGAGDYDNGNGSLMRILPVALRFAGLPEREFLKRIYRASRITHAHPRSCMACGFYGLLVRNLLSGADRSEALSAARGAFLRCCTSEQELQELPRFRVLLEADIAAQPESHISSGGYVMETLHAAVWCLLTTDSLEECILRAVNLGGDTDTTGCVAGGLAGVHYGERSIPGVWKQDLARGQELRELFALFAAACCL